MPCRGKGPSAGLQETQFPGRPPERKRCVPGVERGWWGQPGSLWTTLTAPPATAHSGALSGASGAPGVCDMGLHLSDPPADR